MRPIIQNGPVFVPGECRNSLSEVERWRWATGVPQSKEPGNKGEIRTTRSVSQAGEALYSRGPRVLLANEHRRPDKKARQFDKCASDVAHALSVPKHMTYVCAGPGRICTSKWSYRGRLLTARNRRELASAGSIPCWTDPERVAKEKKKSCEPRYAGTRCFDPDDEERGINVDDSRGELREERSKDQEHAKLLIPSCGSI